MNDTNNTNPNLSKLNELKVHSNDLVSNEVSNSGDSIPTTSEVTPSVENFTSPDQGLDTKPQSISQDDEEKQQKAIQKAQEYENRLNTELGLEMPDGLSEDDQSSWSVLFSRIRSLYAKGYIESKDVYSIFETFDNLAADQKLSGLNNLYDWEQTKDGEVAKMEETLYLQERLDYIQNFSKIFPEDLRKEFLYYVQNGETMDEAVEKQLNSQIEDNQDSLAYQRLQNYVGATNSGKVLTVEDLVGKFDLDDTAKSNQTYTTSPVRVPKPPQGQPREETAPTQQLPSTPQSVTPLPKAINNNPNQTPTSITHQTKSLGDLIQ
ncbi:hypothetical protein HC864_01400 [Candidatus Gracilibacteria bacterium]|nr:hypothetical protein [Candidatus Gracilibacteria bacterium]